MLVVFEEEDLFKAHTVNEEDPERDRARRRRRKVWRAVCSQKADSAATLYTL